MRLPPVLAPALAVGLLLVAGLADRALVGEASAARTAALLRFDTDARAMAASVGHALAQVEQEITSGRDLEGVASERLSLPPPRVALPQLGRYGQASRSQLADLLDSTGSTPNGLPEAVVARLLLGPAAPVTGVAGISVEDRLLSGELPVRPEDVPYLARRLGAGADPRVASLVQRLRRAPDPERLPAAPEFLRTLLDTARIEGWATTADRKRMVRYEITVPRLLKRTPESERTLVGLAPDAAPAEATSLARLVAVPGVADLTVSVTPRLPGPLRLTVLRAVLWLSALAGVVGLLGLRRAMVREARAMARERAFLAGVTHELRTPVAAIRVLGETLAGGRGDAREYGALVAEEGQRLEGLVERVLTLARLDEVPSRERVQPAELLRSAVTLMRARAERRGVAMEYHAADDLPECLWNPESVRRALLKLIENAIVHGREHGHMKATASRAGDEILLAVADDGPGVGRADRSRIFGRFERGKTDAPGTGLGLFLVDRVARAHGGRVDLETTPGRGATFTLVLPIGTPDPGQEPPA